MRTSNIVSIIMASSMEEIPKMTTDCKELYSIFMKIGGSFVSDFEHNTCTLKPQNITCNNLREIQNKLHSFELAHRHYPKADFIKYTPLTSNQITTLVPYEFVPYDKRNIKTMQFDVQFEDDGRY